MIGGIDHNNSLDWATGVRVSRRSLAIIKDNRRFNDYRHNVEDIVYSYMKI